MKAICEGVAGLRTFVSYVFTDKKIPKIPQIATEVFDLRILHPGEKWKPKGVFWSSPTRGYHWRVGDSVSKRNVGASKPKRRTDMLGCFFDLLHDPDVFRGRERQEP